MPQDLATYFIIAGGIVGLTLGIFGLAPFLFHGRLERRTEARRLQEQKVYAQEVAMAAEEERRAAAWGVLVDSRRMPRGLLDIKRPDPATAPPLAADDETETADDEAWPWPDIDPGTPHSVGLLGNPTPLIATSGPVASQPFLARPLPDWMSPLEAEPSPEVDDEVLAIFREVMPAKATVGTRAKETADDFEGDVSIADLLLEARWTARGLKSSQAA